MPVLRRRNLCKLAGLLADQLGSVVLPVADAHRESLWIHSRAGHSCAGTWQ